MCEGTVTLATKTCNFFCDYFAPKGGGGEYFWEILVGVFQHPFSDLASNIIGSLSDLKLLSGLESHHKIHSEFSCYLSFLFIWELKQQKRSNSPIVPSKTIPDSRPTCKRSLYPFSHRNDTNTIPLGAAHTYMAYIREYPPPPPPEVSAKRVESPCCAFYHPRKKRKPCNLYIFVVRQVRKWVRVKRGKHRNSTRLAAMLKNKLQVFCCPFFQVQVSEV